jgi:two-component system sensor histidine kinase ChiS
MCWPGIILVLFLTSGFSTLSAHHGYPLPKEGILDLREIEWNDNSILDLNGEWVFYWEKFLDPENFKQYQNTGFPVNVPSYWSSYTLDGKSLPGIGYGTYSLQVLLPENFQSAICVDLPLFDVAYKFYLNERLIGQNGEVGRNSEEEDPWYSPDIFCYIPHSDTLHLLVQVSNFHHRRGGFWQSLVIGSSNKVQDRKERRRMYNYSTIGVLFFFMIFFLIFWSFSRKQVLMLLFSITTMGILMRSVNTGLYFSNFYVDTSWSWQVRMEYLGSYLAQLFGMIFLHKLFPRFYMKWIIRGNTILMLLASVSLFVLPVRMFSYEMLVYQPLLVLFLLHYLIISLIGTLKRKTLDAVFFGTLSFFIFTLINDILLANSAGSVSSNYLSQISFQLFIFAMAVMIILQWIRNDRARHQLESSLRFKNRVLSVIAHDLKNPIASVAQFSDLLNSKPELSSKKHVRNSLRESSQAALTLLDNLLFWGRSESENLSIELQEIEIKDMVKDVVALYQHMAVQKELAFTSDVKEGLKAYADPVLINTVLRNLVSNAIKFTRKGGSVHIRAWQELDTIYCSVADTGVGMKTEYLERFKQEGYLTSSAGTDQEIGTGLGLQLIKDMLEKNNGTLDIDSNADVGSTFTFTLPVKNEE